MKKKLICLVSACIISFTPCTTFAFNGNIQTEKPNNPVDISFQLHNENSSLRPLSINPMRYRKVNVKFSTEWGKYKKISNYITTKSAGGSITATESVTFDTVVNGSIYGLGISTTKSIKSSRKYTLNVPPHKKAYLAVRVKYKVEKGTRQYYDHVLGNVAKSNKYTVKTPVDLDYTIIYN